MGLTHRLTAFVEATRAAHAALRVHGDGVRPEPYHPQRHLGAWQLWRTRRIVRSPAADSLPNTYEHPACLRVLEAELDHRIDRMTHGAADAGNGDVFDRLIDHLVAEAQCELRVEHSLRAVTAHLLVMRNRGDAARVPAQLADVEARLAENAREYAELPQGDRWHPPRRQGDCRPGSTERGVRPRAEWDAGQGGVAGVGRSAEGRPGRGLERDAEGRPGRGGERRAEGRERSHHG